MEKYVEIEVEEITLEGLLHQEGDRKGAVITHPHPLYGGNMHNNVVNVLAAAYAGAGYTTLRFNFRGVGGSGGAHDNGDGEREDVRGAVRALEKRGITNIHLAGYSFGAWVNARVLNTLPGLEAAVLVSPPVDFMDFSFPARSPLIRLVVTGDQDEIARVANVKAMVYDWNPEAALEIVEGADHFYGGRERALRRVLDGFLNSFRSPSLP
jgi:uncharacterized protein